ncbi:MAG: hypothetical protein WCP85_03120, partial [Mariniphaga sp.]
MENKFCRRGGPACPPFCLQHGFCGWTRRSAPTVSTLVWITDFKDGHAKSMFESNGRTHRSAPTGS